MRNFLIALGMAACLGMCADVAFGAPRGREGGGGGGRDGGNVGGAVSEAVDGTHADGGANLHAGPANINAGPGGAKVDVGGTRGGAKVDTDRGRDGNNMDANRNRNSSKNVRIGDRDFDKYGIGALDAERHRRNGDRDNQWRYNRLGNDWFYWMPAGYWMYYRDGRWDRYNVDTYTVYDNGSAVQNANFNGPYYEDSNGFYYMQGGRRVYDPQIHRVAGVDGPIQR
jgi:hypothetical protein